MRFSHLWWFGLLAATICLLAGGCESPPEESRLFVEPHGWWSVSVPDRWTVTRVELDGFRTRLEVHSPSPTPTRDTEAHRIVYELTGPEDEDAPTMPPRVAINALPDRTPAELADAMARLADAPIATVECWAGVCPRVDFTSETESTSVLFVPAPNQRRTYMLKATVPVDTAAKEAGKVAYIFSNFRPGDRPA